MALLTEAVSRSTSASTFLSCNFFGTSTDRLFMVVVAFLCSPLRLCLPLARRVVLSICFTLCACRHVRPRQTVLRLLWVRLTALKASLHLPASLWLTRSVLSDRHLRGSPRVRYRTSPAQPPPLFTEITESSLGFASLGLLALSVNLPEVRFTLGSQVCIRLPSDPSLGRREWYTPVWLGRFLLSSGTLGFCFIFLTLLAMVRLKLTCSVPCRAHL